MKILLQNHSFILMEAAIIEQLRRSKRVSLHPMLLNAPLIYSETGRNELRNIFQEYIDVAIASNIPILLCTSTWRTNKERVFSSDIPSSINKDAFQYLNAIRNAHSGLTTAIKIGGLIGCKNDCYKPEEGLSATNAEQFHAWQINQLADSGVDFLLAATLPNINEATGIAKAMEPTGVPYILSFVINNTGCLLDGTSLPEAIDHIDTATSTRPLGFMINCAYPLFLNADRLPPSLFERLIGYQANASALSHKELDGAADIKLEPIDEWGEAMFELHTTYGIKILGGCCGTNVEHLKYIVNKRNLNLGR